MVTVLDVQWQGQLQSAQPGDHAMTLRDFQPADGVVVPQGAGNLTITATITPGTGDMFSEPLIAWAGPAHADFDIERSAPVGEPFRIPLAPADADLPHQTLSAWSFRAYIHSTPTGARFTGTLSIQVQAERDGRPLPEFPGHPDQWNGTASIGLLEVNGTVRDIYLSSLEGCAPLMASCPARIRADDGRLVPHDATYVEARLEVGLASTGLQLHYHGSDTRQFKPLEPTRTEGSTLVYGIAVNGDGDGPYAKQSLWEFLVIGRPTGGGRAVEAGDYRLTATAYR